MYPYVRNNFKVVEINNVVGLRSGHIIAQTPLAKTDFAGGTKPALENGYILYLVAGKFVSPSVVDGKLAGKLQPILHYTEELFTGPLAELKEFAVEWEEVTTGVYNAYPRGIALNVGDVFTTNNFTGTLATAVYAKVGPTGDFALVADLSVAYTGPLFAVVESTLPDGVTDAVELTYLGLVSYTV